MKRSPLKRTSFKRKAPKQQKGWAKAVKAVIERSGNRCELRIPGVCNGRGEQTDHVLNRSQGGTANPELLRRTCVPCHQFKTTNPLYAAEHGLAINHSVAKKHIDQASSLAAKNAADDERVKGGVASEAAPLTPEEQGKNEQRWMPPQLNKERPA